MLVHPAFQGDPGEAAFDTLSATHEYTRKLGKIRVESPQSCLNLVRTYRNANFVALSLEKLGVNWLRG